MRVVAEIPHPEFRISVFHMNQKYILKIEYGPFEQIYKFSEFDFMLHEPGQLAACVNDAFLKEVGAVFSSMKKNADLGFESIRL